MALPDQSGPESSGHGIYRAPMRARDRDAGLHAGARDCVKRGLVGIGDAQRRLPGSIDEAILAAVDEHGDKAGRMLARFSSLPDGTLVWTEVDDDSYRLGRISGPWRYDDCEVSIETGIHHVRPCEWMSDEFGPDGTPAGAINTFARGGKNFQRIRDTDAENASERLWLQSYE